MVFLLLPFAQRLCRSNVEGLLVVRRRGNRLPGGVMNEPLVALLVQAHDRNNKIAIARPAKRPGEAAVEDHQHVTARKRRQRPVQFVHRQIIVARISLGVLRKKEPSWAVLAWQSDAVARKIEDYPVVATHPRRKVGQQPPQAIKLGQLVCKDLSLKPMGLTQHLRQRLGVGNRRPKFRHAVPVTINRYKKSQILRNPPPIQTCRWPQTQVCRAAVAKVMRC